MTRQRYSERLLAVITIVFSTLLVLGIAEFGLRQLDERIANSESMDPGLIRYHPRWGWTLTPSWRGRHRHFDFEADYSTNRQGFRGKTRAWGNTENSVALLGDSFTFGLGVDDGSNFAARLDRHLPGMQIFNYAVPGFSTDQELLLMRDRVLRDPPRKILLIVYLANDIFDNARAFPLQAEHAKPYFELKERQLILHNQPVPKVTRPSADRRINLSAYLLDDAGQGGFAAYLRGFALWRRFGGVADARLSIETFKARFEPELKLFYALTQTLAEEATQAGAGFALVLLGGASHTLRPAGDSAAFQEYFRAEIERWAGERQLPLIDVATGLRRRYAEAPGTWFFPNDGHLTPRGHEVVASILADALSSGRR